MRRAIVLFGLFLGTYVLAQESPSFRLNEHAFNAGGQPQDGVVLSSSSFQITLVAVGGTVTAATLSGAHFAADGGFVAYFPPPGEVMNLAFTDAVTLVWDADGSIGDYNLYRGQVTAPFDPGYGSCLVPSITDETATDGTTPEIGNTLFYLVNGSIDSLVRLNLRQVQLSPGIIAQLAAMFRQIFREDFRARNSLPVVSITFFPANALQKSGVDVCLL